MLQQLIECLCVCITTITASSMSVPPHPIHNAKVPPRPIHYAKVPPRPIIPPLPIIKFEQMCRPPLLLGSLE